MHCSQLSDKATREPGGPWPSLAVSQQEDPKVPTAHVTRDGCRACLRTRSRRALLTRSSSFDTLIKQRHRCPVCDETEALRWGDCKPQGSECHGCHQQAWLQHRPPHPTADGSLHPGPERVSLPGGAEGLWGLGGQGPVRLREALVSRGTEGRWPVQGPCPTKVWRWETSPAASAECHCHSHHSHSGAGGWVEEPPASPHNGFQ